MFHLKKLRLLHFIILIAVPLLQAKAQPKTIKNDEFWFTAAKQPINSQGGGIFKFKDAKTGKQKYYWYGVHYKEADAYRHNPSVTLPNATFEAVTCYSSTDLVNWTFENNVLTTDETDKAGKTWVGRLGVAYISELKQYAMVVQHGSKVMFALGASPTGQFKWSHEISMESMIGTSNTGDQTVFTDEDTNKSYLVYSYGRGRSKIYVSEIGVKDGKVNLLDCTQIFQGESREGNCMFKYNNKYYMCASNIYGWDASHAYYLVADNIRGPYLPQNSMRIMNGAADDYAHVTQTGFFVSVKAKTRELIIYCGDRWADFAGNGLGYNQWFPLSFQKNEPYFNSLSQWTLDVKNASWQVGANNNYIKNGSFEADRKRIPSIIKPVQQQLTGWVTEVLQGNQISLDSLTSPALNYFNTAQDRKEVIGEKSLSLTDKVNFKRSVFQQVKSTPYVKLTDGYYTLTAKVRCSGVFSKLNMYGKNNQSQQSIDLTSAQTNWRTVTIKKLLVTGGQVEIGFLAEGNANAYCYIDDITLLKN